MRSRREINNKKSIPQKVHEGREVDEKSTVCSVHHAFNFCMVGPLGVIKGLYHSVCTTVSTTVSVEKKSVVTQHQHRLFTGFCMHLCIVYSEK